MTILISCDLFVSATSSLKTIYDFFLQLRKQTIVENYTLTAIFKSEKQERTQKVDVFVIPKRYSVFIQTDKPKYKPGDEVLYRILVLDSNLKPFEVAEGKLKHHIYDGLGNILPEPKLEDNADDSEFAPENQGVKITEDDFNDEETSEANPNSDSFPDQMASKGQKSGFVEKGNGKITTGIYSYNYKLNEEPVEGKWFIKVTINDEAEFATIQPFEVERYKLPRFQVFIDTKHNVNNDEGDILLNIYANYTFGKFVSGKAKITAFVYDMKHPEILQSKVTKDIDVNMKSTVSFRMAGDLNIGNSIRPYEVKFYVEFEEALTGQVQPANTTVRIYKYHEFSMNIVREKRRFKPGFPYMFEVQVMQTNGHPAGAGSTESLKLSVEYHYKPLICTLMSEVNETIAMFKYTEKKRLVGGKAQFTLHIPENTTAFLINATYFESKATVKVLRHDAATREYMTIELKKFENGTRIL